MDRLLTIYCSWTWSAVVLLVITAPFHLPMTTVTLGVIAVVALIPALIVDYRVHGESIFQFRPQTVPPTPPKDTAKEPPVTSTKKTPTDSFPHRR